MTGDIQIITADDASDYRRVRLKALREHPEAFSSSYEDEVVLDPSQIADRLTAPGFTRFGGYVDGSLVGLAGLQIWVGAKVCHKARLFSMYVDPAHRRTDLAPRLIEAVIAGARDGGATVLQLSVTVGNMPAQRLYRRMGFAVYGLERRSLRIDGRFYDEELMALDLV